MAWRRWGTISLVLAGADGAGHGQARNANSAVLEETGAGVCLEHEIGEDISWCNA
jgi:hypothetical protein